jgi:hypothetical protein
MNATVIVDATGLHSKADPEDDDYIDSPLAGYLHLTLVQGNDQQDVRILSIKRSDFVTPLNLSAQVTCFIFANMGWDGDQPLSNPKYPDLTLGDRFFNSGLDGKCLEGEVSGFEIDTDSDSPTFGSILP